jgi:hypothetical protein
MLSVSPLPDRAGLRLEGEADLTRRDEIRKALAALPPATTIHLELARLEFIDVAATRELIALTRQPPHPRLILHDPPAVLQRLIGLLWPEANAESRVSSDSSPTMSPPSHPVTADRRDGPSSPARRSTGAALALSRRLGSGEPEPSRTHFGIMPVILVKLIMACSGSGVLLWRRWCQGARRSVPR